ncbi:hypothetical protein DESUT3_11860 [Desulfuromonas versatilis]|uniref:Lipoprotein n=1 Tax=Desulfuromonas versatilis TaxID=2802975 RepID=A0ABM8HSY5_9BACT|nr:hypothetical protein [Desulfuromonas versatilis]BCR04117.1 hypothetical protein DESUT3_11860 [Desulfuromonas versatilis]
MNKVAGLAFAMLVALLLGCAAGGTRDKAPPTVDELAEKDLKALSDSELLAYYYDLDEQIRRREGSYGGTSIGFGVGSGGRGGGVGVGVTQHVGGGSVAEALRARRTEVRVELLRRGINP